MKTAFYRMCRRDWIACIVVLVLVPFSSHLAAATDPFNVQFARSNSSVESIARALSLLDGGQAQESVVQQHSTLNFSNEPAQGNFSDSIPFAYSDTFAVRARRNIEVLDAGVYTIGVHSDDGVRVIVDNQVLINDDVLRSATNSFASRFLSQGIHSLEVVYFENSGGASLELFAAWGNFSGFNSGFGLVDGYLSVSGADVMPANVGGKWDPVMNWPLVAVSMANLPDGRILTYSGSERRTWPRTEQTYSVVWDPVSGQFDETLHVGHNMFCAATSMTQDGKVFVNGGRNASNSPWTSVFDYETSTWSQIENMASGGRWYPTALALGDGSIFTAMGNSSNVANPDLWTEDDGWRVLNGINFLSMRQRRNERGRENVFPLLSQAPNGSIYHFWDTVENHFISPSGNGSATQANPDTDHGNHAGGVQTIYDEGKLLITGNNDGSWGGNSSVVTSNAFTVDLTGSRPVIRDTGDMKHRRKFHQLLPLPTGEVLVVGGNTTGVKFQDNGSVFETEIWNPESGQWRSSASLAVPRDYHSTALLMTDGRVITAGGGYDASNPSSGGTHQDAQIYSPPYLFTQDNQLAQRPTLASDESVLAYGQTFSVSTTGDIEYFSLIKMSSTSHAINTDNRQFRPAFSQISNNRFAIEMHDNPNVATPGYWMLFAVDSDGVPSVADVIKIDLDREPPTTVAPPVVDPIIASPVSAQLTQTYSVNATSTGVLRYSWNFGDGSGDSTSTTQNSIEHRFPAAGRYVVTVTVTDNAGQQSRQSFVQMVHGSLLEDRPTASAAMVEIEERDEIWIVNPDNDSVTGINTRTLQRFSQLVVGEEPRAIALAPDGRLWVVNKGGASISIVNPSNRNVVATVPLDVGSAPHGIVFGNNRAYVALEGLATIVQLDAGTGSELRRSFGGETPRHLSLNSVASKLYVSNFITPRLPGEDGLSPVTNGVGGEVRVFTTSANSLEMDRVILLSHIDRDVSEHAGPGIPNYLGPAVISPDGTRAWVPSKQDNILSGVARGEPGMTFDQTVRAVSSPIDLNTHTEMLSQRVDHDNASVGSHAAFGPNGLVLFTSLEGNRQVSIIDTTTALEIARFDVGRAPQSVVLSADGLRLYVHNFMDRSTGVYDVSDVVLRGGIEVSELVTIDNVSNEKLLPAILRGKQLFYDARDDRLAALDYMSCASCHNEGGHDGRVWDFTGEGEGLRNTISLVGAAGPGNGLMHWSANFDEVQDFEAQIRDFAGGTGLMSNSDFQAGSRSTPLGDPKAGVSADLDALAAYLESLDSHGPSPYRTDSGALSAQAQIGKQLFRDNGCATCHSGERFTDSGQAVNLHDIGTLDAESGSRLGGSLDGIDTPSLLGAWLTGPYLHDGSANTVASAISAHNDIDLSNGELAQLEEFIMQLSESDAVEEQVPDTQFPTIALTQPSAAEISNSSQSFEGTASDTGGSGLLNVSYLIRDLTSNQFVDASGATDNPRVVRDIPIVLSTASSGAWHLDTVLPVGRYRFYARAHDNSGNSSDWIIRKDVTIHDEGEVEDTLFPVAVLTQPTASDISLSTQRFAGTASDTGGSGLSKVSYLIRDLTSGHYVNASGATDNPRVVRDMPMTLRTANSGQWQLDTDLPAGRYRLYARAVDNTGNTTSWIVRKDVTIHDDNEDTQLPTATITRPTADEINSASQRFEGIASDTGGSGLLQVSYLIRDLATSQFVDVTGAIEDPGVIRNTTLELSSADSGTWHLDTTLPDGRYRLYIRVRDNGDNTTTWIVRNDYVIVANTAMQ